MKAFVATGGSLANPRPAVSAPAAIGRTGRRVDTGSASVDGMSSDFNRGYSRSPRNIRFVAWKIAAMDSAQDDTTEAAGPNDVHFFLNGHPVLLHGPSPDLLLIDYLRSPEVALAGPKKPCGQGGCGGCTVVLSHWDGTASRAEHRAINACLRPVVSLHGLAVTTVEGTGSVRKPNPRHLAHTLTSSRGGPPPDAAPPPALVEAQAASAAKRDAVRQSAREAVENIQTSGSGLDVALRHSVPEAPSDMSHTGMNPVAWRLAMNNGTQCGYCTVGFVMNMSEFIINNPGATKREIEDAMDGNLCRCTGYRPIMTGMKTFASDWTPADEAARMKCLADPDSRAQRPTGSLVIPFPPAARHPASGANVQSGRRQWLSPSSTECMKTQRSGARFILLFSRNTWPLHCFAASMASLAAATVTCGTMARSKSSPSGASSGGREPMPPDKQGRSFWRRPSLWPGGTGHGGKGGRATAFPL